jgi:hypothetical protein
MPLKAVVDSLEGVDKSLQGLYEKGADNKFYLGVEGMVPSSRLDEFRTNNITLKQQLEKYDGIDPVKYKEMSEKERKIAEKKLIDAGDVDKLVELRVAAMRTEHENTLKTTVGERDAANTRLSSVLIDSAVKSSAIAIGVVPTAVDDVVLRAKATFQVKSGDVVAHDAKGNIIYGKDGQTPLTVDDWVKGLKTSAPHLFEGMKGSGAPGGRTSTNGMDTSKMSSTQKIAHGMSQKAG